MMQPTKEDLVMLELDKKNNYFDGYLDEEDCFVLINKIPKDKTELIEDAKLYNELLIKGRKETEARKATGIDW